MTSIIADNIFRGYDIRGKIPDELNAEGAFALGQAYAYFLHQRRINQCVTIRDNRVHSEELQQAFVKALLAAGIDVIDHGLGPVYFMYFSQYLHQSKAGVSVSASHNPKEYNGFKLAVGFSDTMISEEIQELKKIVKAGLKVSASKPGKLIQKPIFPEYLANLQRLFADKFDFKIFMDGGNCTPSLFLPQLLESFGCQVTTQNTELDGTFPLGTPDPTEAEYLNRVAEGVKKNKSDLGVCYDPDGDRLGIVDNLGRPIWNDVLVALFARDVLDYLPGAPIVFNVLCSKMVVESITESGGRPIMWQTGHSFIKAKVKESRAPFGGELSGHFFFMDNWFGHDDAAYATLRLLAYLKRKKQTLSQAVDKLPFIVSSPEIKLGLPDAIKFSFIKDTLGPKLKALYPDAQAVEIDGLRLDTPAEMMVIRASQNGPYITIKFEAKTKSLYDALKAKLNQLLKEHQEVDWSYGVNVEAFR